MSSLRRYLRALPLLLAAIIVTTVTAADLNPTELVSQLYRAHRSKHDPLDETRLLGSYFDSGLLNLYLKDKREAKREVGRLDGDPLYNAQEIEIKDFSVSRPETVNQETRVTVRFKNIDNRTSVVYVLAHIAAGWRISDIRYDDGSSLKKILQAPL